MLGSLGAISSESREEYLDKQKLKLGHLIKTYKRIKGGKKNEQK